MAEHDELPSLAESVAEAYDTLADEDPPVEAKPQEAAEAPKEATEPAQQEELPEDRIPIPSSWKRDSKAAQSWDALPRELQEQIYNREYQRDRETSRRIQELAERGKFYGALEQTLNPHLKDIYAAGVRPEQVVAEAVELWRMSRQDKDAAARYFLATLGVDVSKLIEGTEQVDPKYSALEQKQRELEAYIAKQEQAKHAEYNNWLSTNIEAFVDARDDQGQPRYPYVEHLADDMKPHIYALRAQYPQADPRAILDEAYQRAYWANPQTRELEIKRIQQAQVAEHTKRTEAAKRASVQVNGAPTPGIAQLAAKDSRSAMEEIYDLLSL